MADKRTLKYRTIFFFRIFHEYFIFWGGEAHSYDVLAVRRVKKKDHLYHHPVLKQH